MVAVRPSNPETDPNISIRHRTIHIRMWSIAAWLIVLAYGIQAGIRRQVALGFG